MNPRPKKTWVATAGTLLILFLWWLARPEPVPVSQGQSLAFWFDQISRSRTVAQTQESKQAIQSLGSAAVPFLAKRLHVRDSPWEKRYRDFYSSLLVRRRAWLVSRLPAPSVEHASVIRMNAVIALGWLETAALPAAPDLASVLDDESHFVRFSAGQLLRTFGPAAHETLPVLLRVLQNTNAAIADNVVGVVASVGRDVPGVVPSLVILLRGPDEVQVRALRVLSQLGEPARLAEPNIAALLRSTNSNVRTAALSALWELVPARHVELFPEIAALAKSRDKRLRSLAGFELVRMQPLTPQAGELLAALIREGEDGFNWTTLVSLGKRGRDASNAVTAIIAGLDAENPRIAAKAAETLGNVGRPEESILHSLEKAGRHEHLMVRDAAQEAVSRLQSQIEH